MSHLECCMYWGIRNHSVFEGWWQSQGVGAQGLCRGDETAIGNKSQILCNAHKVKVVLISFYWGRKRNGLAQHQMPGLQEDLCSAVCFSFLIRWAYLNALLPLSARILCKVFLFSLYCGPCDARGHVLWPACTPGLSCAWHPFSIKQIFVKWVSLQLKFWYQAGELDVILS